MHKLIVDNFCFMATLPEAQAKRLGLFLLLGSDVMACLALILCPGLVGAQHIRRCLQDIEHRGKLGNSKAVFELTVAGKAQV